MTRSLRARLSEAFPDASGPLAGLIEQAVELDRLIRVLSRRIPAEPVLIGATGFAQMHPAVDRVVKLRVELVRVLVHLQRLGSPASVDEFDAFLAELQRTAKPHRSVHRGDP